MTPAEHHAAAMLFRLNRARFRAAGWTLRSVLSLPVLAVRTALFPTIPRDALPDAPPLPLLPAQQAVQARVDRARWSAEQDPGDPQKRDKPRPAPPRVHRLNRVTLRPIEVRDGRMFEPLSHHAHGSRRHYPPRPWQEA